MTDDRPLWLRLKALCRAHERDYFADGHRDGAIISGVYLYRKNEAEPDAANTIATIVEKQWAATELCSPFVAERPAPVLVDQITATLGAHLTGLRQAGHNVISANLSAQSPARSIPVSYTHLTLPTNSRV